MNEYTFVALLLAVVGPVLALARFVDLPPSLALFALGVASPFVPGLPPVHVDPQFVLNLFLPPLLYASTVRVSWHLLRFTLLPGVVLGALLPLATIGAVALAARFILLPGAAWTTALLLATVASIFDTRLFHEAKGRPHVPRAVADTLKAREIVGRVVVLATVSFVVEAAAAAHVSAVGALKHYVLDIAAGMLLGLAVGHVVAWARRRIEIAPIEIAVSIATPFAAALGARALGISVVAAVTTAALTISAIRIDEESGESISSAEARISSTAFWEEASLLVSSVLFFLAGRVLPQALAAIAVWSFWMLLGAAAGVLAIVVAVQFTFGYAATTMAPIAAVLEERHAGSGAAAAAAAMAWSCTRSVIGLVVALSLPRDVPERDLILVVAALAIVGSVLLQGLTLRRVVERASLSDQSEEEAEENAARKAMLAAAPALPDAGAANGFDAARQALLRLRRDNRIGDEVLLKMLRETDLQHRAAEGNTLPGSGPPNP